MGWTSTQATYFKPNGKVDVKAECEALFTWHSDDNPIACHVLKSTVIRSVWYGAVEKQWTDGSAQPIIFAGVVRISLEKDGIFDFTYKGMDETVGPCYYDCPDSILDLLTPTDNQAASNWRAVCRQENTAKRNPKHFAKLPEGAQALWTVPSEGFTGLEKGQQVTLTKGRVSSRPRARKAWVYGRYYLLPRSVSMDDYQLL